MKRITRVLWFLMLVLILNDIPCIDAISSNELRNPTPGGANGKWEGSYVYFGNYEGKPVEWQVLRVENNTLLLLSSHVLSYYEFASYNNTTCEWADSDVRKYLNNVLIRKLFTDEEIAIIADSTVPASPYPWSQDSDRLMGGNDTIDKLFLPSYEDITSSLYGFGPDQEEMNGTRRAPDLEEEYYKRYWLRTSGRMRYGYHYPMMIQANGLAVCPGVFGPAITWEEGIRPMLRVSKNSNLWSTSPENKPKTTKVSSIAIKSSSSKLTVGKKLTLKAVITPANATNKKVTWSSSNKKYATVNSKGTVTAKKAGAGKTVKITAKAQDGSGKKATYKLKIVKSEPKISIAKCKIALSKSSYTYSGKEIKPIPTVKYNNKALKKGTDYTLSYKNNKNVGKATITVKGKGKYTGQSKITFTIKQKKTSKVNISKCKISLSQKEYTYTGSEIKPLPKVKYNGKTLKKGTDYTLSYKDNKKVGKATITVKGKGTYTGQSNIIFAIKQKKVSKINISKCKVSLSKKIYAYTGSAIKPLPTVKYNSMVLTNGTDYTLSYKNNKKAGSATITVKGKGTYTGQINVGFTVKQVGNTISNIAVKFKGDQYVDLKWGWNIFNQDASDYNHDIAKAGLILSKAAESSQASVETRLRALGFDNIKSQWYEGAWNMSQFLDSPGTTFASQAVKMNGKNVVIMAIVVRGTSDVGDFVTDLLSQIDGFAPAASNVWNSAISYYDTLSEYYGFQVTIDNTVLFITGHSLGGAVAGMLAPRMEMCGRRSAIFDYTFASPNYITMYETDRAKYTNIHNIINKKDMITDLPVLYKRYGRDWYYSNGKILPLGDHVAETYLECLESGLPTLADEDGNASGEGGNAGGGGGGSSF